MFPVTKTVFTVTGYKMNKTDVYMFSIVVNFLTRIATIITPANYCLQENICLSYSQRILSSSNILLPSQSVRLCEIGRESLLFRSCFLGLEPQVDHHLSYANGIALEENRLICKEHLWNCFYSLDINLYRHTWQSGVTRESRNLYFPSGGKISERS